MRKSFWSAVLPIGREWEREREQAPSPFSLKHEAKLPTEKAAVEAKNIDVLARLYSHKRENEGKLKKKKRRKRAKSAVKKSGLAKRWRKQQAAGSQQRPCPCQLGRSLPSPRFQQCPRSPFLSLPFSVTQNCTVKGRPLATGQLAVCLVCTFSLSLFSFSFFPLFLHHRSAIAIEHYLSIIIIVLTPVRNIAIKMWFDYLLCLPVCPYQLYQHNIGRRTESVRHSSPLKLCLMVTFYSLLSLSLKLIKTVSRWLQAAHNTEHSSSIICPFYRQHSLPATSSLPCVYLLLHFSNKQTYQNKICVFKYIKIVTLILLLYKATQTQI